MMKRLLLFTFLLSSQHLFSQTNVRSWYADGQVWIVWNISLPIPETVGVFASEEPFSSTEDANLIGRPFHLDYLPVAMKEQLDTAATYRIPDGHNGTYTLAQHEGLFVFTPHQSGSMYFAVVPWGDTLVAAGENVTDTAVVFTYDPVSDPVECHLQSVFASPFTTGYLCFAFYMWVDGRDDYRDGRPDFPVMANGAKNGMPGFFLISVPNDLNQEEPFPLSVWLHGGGGNSRQSLAGSRAEVYINPLHGILLSHNDDMFGHRNLAPPKPENPTWHFGWRKSYDPFSGDNLPTETDTIINYTQRRYLWIDHWLMRNFNIDPARIHIHGHSMGSAGATALAKAYPDHYASATIFNNGFDGPEEGSNIAVLFGEASLNFPTNLKNRQGETVRLTQLFDLITNISAERDLPVIRSYHGKNDDNGTMSWDTFVVENYRVADSAGHGMHLYWSERPHGMDMAPDFDDHWIQGIGPLLQTITDNVSWAEIKFRSDISYPAFHNHQQDVNAHDPGDGTIGTGVNGVGDDWGTWGGWHRWDNASIIDLPNEWAVEAWLESNAAFDPDNCPYPSLTADVAIRRPVMFKPTSGDMFTWIAEDVSTQEILQQGDGIVGPDDLVVVPGIILYPENIRRVRIHINPQGVSTSEADNSVTQFFSLYPNPSTNDLTVIYNAQKSETTLIRILHASGTETVRQSVFFSQGENRIQIHHLESISPGIYYVQLLANGDQGSRIWIKQD